jgi:protoporphyrinogen oxidase
VWSTIPIPVLARTLQGGVPRDVSDAARAIRYRAMILIYVQLPVDQFTEYDAHYFPGASTKITRLSEPKNYSALGKPAGSTVLCAELPCNVDDDVWRMSEHELGRLVAEDLRNAEIPLPAEPTTVFARRLPQAYPIYVNGYEHPFATLDRWVDSQPRLLSYGRQGLFAHDNTHHALFMAYSAVECLSERGFDEAKWREFRKVFATHVVED